MDHMGQDRTQLNRQSIAKPTRNSVLSLYIQLAKPKVIFGCKHNKLAWKRSLSLILSQKNQVGLHHHIKTWRPWKQGEIWCHMLGSKTLQRFHENVNEHIRKMWDRDDSRGISKTILLYDLEKLSTLHNILETFCIHKITSHVAPIFFN